MEVGSLTERTRARNLQPQTLVGIYTSENLQKPNPITTIQPTTIRANENQIQTVQNSQSEIEERQLQTLETFFLYRSFLFLRVEALPNNFFTAISLELPPPPQNLISAVQEIEIGKKATEQVVLFQELANKNTEELFVADSLTSKNTESSLPQSSTHDVATELIKKHLGYLGKWQIEYLTSSYIHSTEMSNIPDEKTIEDFYRICKQPPRSDSVKTPFSNPAFVLLAVQEGCYTDVQELLMDCLHHGVLKNPNFTLEIIASSAKQGLLNKESVEFFKALGFSGLSEKVIRNYEVIADLVASSFIKDIQRPKFSIKPLPRRELKDGLQYRYPYPGSLYRAIKTFIQSSPIIEADELEEIFKYVEANFGKTYRKDLEVEAYGHGVLKNKPEILPEDISQLYELGSRGIIIKLNFLATAVKYGVIDDLAEIKLLIPKNNAENDDLYQEALLEAYKRNNNIELANHFKAITNPRGQDSFIKKLLESGIVLAEKEYQEIFDKYNQTHLNNLDVNLNGFLHQAMSLGLIKDQNYLLKILRQYDMGAISHIAGVNNRMFINSLIVDGVNNGVFKYDRAFLKAIESENQGSEIPLPEMAAAKIEQLKKDPKTRINFEEETLKEIRKVFIDLQRTNQTAEGHQKIDIDKFMAFLSASVINLYAIDSKLAKNIINDVLYQRKNPQMTRDTLLHSTNLTPEEINLFKKFTSKHENLLEDNPHFLVDVIAYLQAFKNFDIDLNTFTSIVTTGDFLKANQLSGELALELIKSISSNQDLGIEINIDKVRANGNCLNDWDFRYLGTLMSSAKTWTKEQRKESGLILKAKFEGTEAGLVSPQHYSQFALDVYGDSEAQTIAENIRMQNLNLLREAEGHGVNISLWLNAHDPEFVKPKYTLGRETQRKPEEIMRDFRAYYGKFKKWFEKEHLDPENPIYTKSYSQDSIYYKPDQGIVLNLDQERKYWSKIETENKAWISSKTKKEIFTRENFNKQFAYSFGKHFLFIKELYQELLPEYQLPEAFGDMDKIYQEMLDYNFDSKPETSKNFRIRFLDPKDIGHLIFMGNRANSCTAFGRNASAVFGFARHLGTKYLVIEDTSSTLENPNGNAKGYIRIFLGINDKHKPVIYYDTIDGSIAGKYKVHMEEYLNEFAAKVGLPVQERDGKLIDIIGGAPEGYFNHGSNSDKPLNPGPRAINDIDTLKTWVPKTGWTNKPNLHAAS